MLGTPRVGNHSTLGLNQVSRRPDPPQERRNTKHDTTQWTNNEPAG